ncbi:hypothetical protein [Nocardia amamiensis]|uniref:hypothetical protein n=1 Tax=Nocardia TaxID=1817 RepID=UPI0033DD539B
MRSASSSSETGQREGCTVGCVLLVGALSATISRGSGVWRRFDGLRQRGERMGDRQVSPA